MVDNDSDEALGSRLDSALRTGLDLKHVDVATLVEGSQRRARRIRTRRMATLAAAAVLVLAVPVGYEVINPGPGSGSQSAAMLPSSSRPGATKAAEQINRRPNPTAIPSAAAPAAASSAASSKAGASIPDAFAFTAAELPAGLVLDGSTKKVGDLVVDGQDCGGTDKVTQPVVARQWVWSSNRGKADELTVNLTVTAWEAGAAAPAFAAATDATGNCRWEDPQTLRVLPGVSADETWASTSDVPGDLCGRAVLRIGDGIVGIEVVDPTSVVTAAALADKLAGIQADRLRSGILTVS